MSLSELVKIIGSNFFMIKKAYLILDGIYGTFNRFLIACLLVLKISDRTVVTGLLI